MPNGLSPNINLGMPSSAKNKEVEVWSEVLERCVRKLTRWKNQYLSLDPKPRTLIKSVMDAFPTYMMKLIPTTKQYREENQQSRRVFLCLGNKREAWI